MDVDRLHSASSAPTYDMETMTPMCVEEETATKSTASFNHSAQGYHHSFIFRLPTEILETIFIERARDHHSEHNGRPIPTAPSWVNVSYVCRRWRNVAVNCPSLWTYLFVVSPRWTKELLARSKQASLKLHLNLEYADRHLGSCFLEQLTDDTERIQELHLQRLGSTVNQNFPKIFSHGDTQALRTLKLTDCHVPWYSFTLSGLTTLSLCRIPRQLQQNIVEFLATLSCAQGLTHLYLEDALTRDAVISNANLQKINLPHLSHLLIVAPLSTVIALLDCVRIPLKTEVRLECCSEDDSSLDDYAQLSSLVAQRFGTFEDQASFGPTIRSLVMDTSEWRKTMFTFSASERECDSSRSEWGCNIPLRIVVHFSILNNMTRVISDICRSVPPTNVQSLHVLYPPRSSTFWMHILGHLQDLQYLRLSHGKIPDLACVLSLPPRDSAMRNQGTDRVFAPALVELELFDVLFSPLSARSLYDALSSRTGPGQLTMTGVASTFQGRVHWFNQPGFRMKHTLIWFGGAKMDTS